MQANANEVAQGKSLWADAYILWRKYYRGEDNDEFWTALISEADELCKKHKGDELFSSIAKCVVDDIERRYKGAKKK